MSGTLDQFLDSIGQNGLKLTPAQEKALEVLEWLDVSGPQGDGRTTVLALHHLKTARDNPGFPVKLVDHWDNGWYGTENVARAVAHLLDKAPKDTKKNFVVRNGILRYQEDAVTTRGPVDITYTLGGANTLTSTDSFPAPGLKFKPSPLMKYPGYSDEE